MKIPFNARVSRLVEDLEEGNAKEFARKTGIPYATLHRNLTEKYDGEHLIKHSHKIISTYPQINREWLEWGRGEPYTSGRTTALRTAENTNGFLVGDIISEALSVCYTDDGEEIENVLVKKLPQFKEILNSSRYPSFQELELLCNLINLDANAIFLEQPRALFKDNRVEVDDELIKKLKRNEIALPPSPLGQSLPPNTPHIDTSLVADVIEVLEEFLKEEGKSLPPKAKAEVIGQLYELMLEKEEETTKPVRMLRLIKNAMAKAS